MTKAAVPPVARRAKSATPVGELGAIPACRSPRRRDACQGDLRKFCETYLADQFPLKWSPDHLRALERIGSVVREGGQFALAMPRGSGKSTMLLAASLWALLYAHQKFVLLMTADLKQARQAIRNIKRTLATNATLLADFPAVCVPIRQLEGIAHRARHQLHDGASTGLVWDANTIVLPDIPGSAAAGGILHTAALLLARGTNVGGRRPTMCLLDDPQTRTSARSRGQTDNREQAVSSEVIAQARGVYTPAVLAGTAIEAEDLICRFVDRRRHPEWQGELYRTLNAFPTNMALWQQYWELGIQARNENGSPEQVRQVLDAFYRKNRTRMDAGAEVAWPERKPNSISALQYAMDAFFRSESAFQAECQNLPRPRPAASRSRRPAGGR